MKLNRCWICKEWDDKRNMEYAVYGFYSDSKRYFHYECMRTVICAPTDFDNNIVDRALWCHDNLVEQWKETAKEDLARDKKIQKALETLECITPGPVEPRGTATVMRQ